MAKIYETESRKTFDSSKGAGGWIGSVLSPIPGLPFWAFKKSPNITKGDYKDFELPKHDMTSLTKGKIKDALDYYIEHINEKNSPTFKNEMTDILGGTNIENKLAYIDLVVDKNADKLGFNSAGTQFVQNEDGSFDTSKPITSDTNYNSGLDYYKQLIEDSATTNRNSEFAKQYQADMYSNINAYEQATNATLASAELDAYKMLGQQQLQLENQIASQRMQALKSGVTSAQLASQELANMFAAQSSAQQVAQNVLAQRADSAATFNQQRAGVMTGLYDILANNQTTQANAYAQLGAAQASYNSYMQQPYAQYQAMLQAARDPYYTKGMNPNEQ